jgi:hypothetical protein
MAILIAWFTAPVELLNGEVKQFDSWRDSRSTQGIARGQNNLPGIRLLYKPSHPPCISHRTENTKDRLDQIGCVF